MLFFSNPTVTQLIESNIQRVVKLEKAQSEKLLVDYKAVRIELVDRLLNAQVGTFTQQQLRVTLVQVEAAIQALTTKLNQTFDSAVNILGEQGIKDLTKEIESFSGEFEGSVQPIPLAPVLIAQEAKNFLFNQYQISLEAYGQDVLQNVARGLTQALIARDSFGQVVQKLSKFLKVEEFKLARIARTELHNVYNLSKLQGMRQVKADLIPDIMKTLIHPIDDRTGEDSKKLAKINIIVPVDKPFKFKFKDEERVFMTPPDRPNDRAILVPFRKAWDK